MEEAAFAASSVLYLYVIMKFIEVVAGIIRNEKGEFLIARRSPGKTDAGLWEFPGGKIEPHETPSEALQRELLEELHIETGSYEYYDTSVHNNGTIEITLHCYFGKLLSGIPVATVHDNIQWVTALQLHAYEFAPADKPVIQKLIKEFS